MISSATLVSDVKEEFEGGNSLSVDWDVLIRRAMENVMDNLRPETLKRIVPIYGGLAQDLYRYYCPTDVLVPSDLYLNDDTRSFSYVPPRQFYRQLKNNTYTIEYINGVRFLTVRHNETASSITVDSMDAVGTIGGGTTATLNEHNFLTGSGAIQANFTSAGEELGDTFDTAIDITDYLKGIVIVPAYLPTAEDIVSIEFRLKTDDSNYYTVISTADSIGDSFVDGWNMVRFSLANATQTGSPTASNITEWSVLITTDAGETETVIFDKITIQKTNPFYLEYYSNKPFVDATTGSWQTTVSYADNDSVNVDRDVAGILHYELCILVNQAASFQSVDGQAARSFEGQLKRKYDAYWSAHPASEAPLTYSKSPEIEMFDDDAFGRIQPENEELT